MDESKWYDTGEAAKFLGCRHQNVDQQRRKGHIKARFFPNVGKGGKWMFHERELLKYIWSDYYTGRKSWERRQAKKTEQENDDE
jgi:hypothetical protein